MFDSIFTSILATESTASALTSSAFFMCSITSLILGVAIALIYMFKHEYSKNFVVTLALLPIIVQVVISLVNGNIGAGIAVMGVFNLVRFRSIPGSAKDIGAVFLAMAIGLATGMGYLALACIFTVIVGLANVIFVLSPLGAQKNQPVEKALKVTIPESIPVFPSDSRTLASNAHRESSIILSWLPSISSTLGLLMIHSSNRTPPSPLRSITSPKI
jgi:hypothetical protein